MSGPADRRMYLVPGKSGREDVIMARTTEDMTSNSTDAVRPLTDGQRRDADRAIERYRQVRSREDAFQTRHGLARSSRTRGLRLARRSRSARRASK